MQLKSALFRQPLWLAFAVVAAASFAVPCSVQAQSWPARAVTIIIPFGAGSATDTATRRVAAYLQNALGQPFVVENRTGANGMLSANAVARAAPDGYTLLVSTNSTHSAAPALYKNMTYDPIKDFTPIAKLGVVASYMSVNNDLPIKTPAEFVAYAKANPGKLTYGSGNTTGQVSGETIKRVTGIHMERISYRTNPPAIADLIAGHISAMFIDSTNAFPLFQAQKVRPIAQLTRQRSPLLPDVPTLSETIVPDFDVVAWVGLFGPANTPPEVVKVLERELAKMTSDKAIIDQFVATGMEIQWGGPAEFSEYVKTELVKWTKLIKEAGIEQE